MPVPLTQSKDTKLTFGQIFGNFMVGPRVAQEFRSLSVDLIFAKKKCGAGFIPAPQTIVTKSSIYYPPSN